MPAEPDGHSQAEADDVAPELVLQALEAVVSSPTFSRSLRPARFLRYLVETALRKEPQLLKESVVGAEVFERPPTWDPRLDPIVRQEAARLRKRLARYYEANAAAEVRIDLPVGTYVPVFRRQTTETEAPPIPEPPRPPQRSHAGRKIAVYALAGVFCVAAGIAAWRVAEHRNAGPSIVVLPFTDLSPDPSTQYFADGLTDEITDALARLKGLRVIARSSAFQFKGKSADVHEVGRRLNVANVVEGSVARSGDRIRIIAHLERVSDGSLLWSNKYESASADLFNLQADLAAGIAGALRQAAAPPHAKYQPGAEAHDYVLKGRYDTQQLTPESLTRAAEEYHHAVELDPNYADAYLGLSVVEYNQYAARGSTHQSDAERRETAQWVRKALELDPDLPGARGFQGFLAMTFDWDWVRAEREFQAGVAGSSAPSESYYALFLVYRGRFSEADQHIQRMLDLDPFSTTTLNNLCVARNLEGRFAEAREGAQRMAAAHPKMIAPQQMIGMTYVEEGRPDLGMPIFQAVEPQFPAIRVFEASAQAAAGKRGEALRLLQPFIEEDSKFEVSGQWIAFVYAYLHDAANTVKWLQRSADRRESQALTIGVHPIFAPIRNTPAFQALEKRIGLE